MDGGKVIVVGGIGIRIRAGFGDNNFQVLILRIIFEDILNLGKRFLKVGRIGGVLMVRNKVEF